MKYVFITKSFESSALALYLKAVEGKDVKVYVEDPDNKSILECLIDKENDYIQYMGEDNLFIFDDQNHGKMADSLRAKNEIVYGGSEISDKLENDRMFGISIMEKYGILAPESHQFKGVEAFNEAIKFVENNRVRWVIKQNGDLNKSFSTVGKFENGEDIIDKLNDFKRMWEGEHDFILQKFVEGHEIAVEGFFNGKEWITDKSGEPVFILNWEHKKKSDGDTGRTTGETGTLMYRSHKDSPISKELVKITPFLEEIRYVGNIDLNFIVSEKDSKFYGLEWSPRFGYPALNLQTEFMNSSWSELLEGCATGKNGFLDVKSGWSIVVVIQVPPYPFTSRKEEDNAKGQRIYFLKNGEYSESGDIDLDKLKHIHLYEVKYEEETKHFLATGDTGYLMTITASGDTIKQANENVLKFIHENIETSNMDYRKDIGINKRVTEGIEFAESNNLI